MKFSPFTPCFPSRSLCMNYGTCFVSMLTCVFYLAHTPKYFLWVPLPQRPELQCNSASPSISRTFHFADYDVKITPLNHCLTLLIRSVTFTTTMCTTCRPETARLVSSPLTEWPPGGHFGPALALHVRSTVSFRLFMLCVRVVE